MSQGKAPFIVLSINHERASLDVRERYSVDDSRVASLYRSLHAKGDVAESLVLNTCNRIEVYSQLKNGTQPERIVSIIADFYGEDAAKVHRHLHLRSGQEAVQHLIEVSAGLRSQITGEAEIFGQVKSAYAASQNLGYAGKVINRIFQKGFQAAKLIRHATSVGEGQINIASVAVDLALKIFGEIESASALAIGTGEIGEKTVKALRSRGATRFGIASRSAERAASIAPAWGGQPHALSELQAYLPQYDIVIASVGASEPVVPFALVEKAAARRKARPLFLIDLGLPRNVEKRCEELDNVFLYNLDDLAAIAEENLEQRRQAVEESRSIAAHKAQQIWDSIVKRLGHPQ